MNGSKQIDTNKTSPAHGRRGADHQAHRKTLKTAHVYDQPSRPWLSRDYFGACSTIARVEAKRPDYVLTTTHYFVSQADYDRLGREPLQDLCFASIDNGERVESFEPLETDPRTRAMMKAWDRPQRAHTPGPGAMDASWRC